MRQNKTGVENRAKISLFLTPKNLRDGSGWVKYLSELIKFNLGPNL